MTSLFDLNDVTISGNLTREPQLRHTAAGTAVCNIRIAHNERRKTTGGEWIDNPQYFDVTIWTNLAEWTARHVTKGDKVVINGRLRWNEYQANDGQTRQAVDINANSLIHVGRREAIQASDDSRDEPAAIRGDDDIPF
jgi:single-strand DNA-binding protein